mmetsp:Transcript_30785/g.67387  ORF Transcript_30785/g.67387 Transcript_30785/m.67387 type:complete len:89 (+) Transcript_30785:850-1116(+)
MTINAVTATEATSRSRIGADATTEEWVAKATLTYRLGAVGGVHANAQRSNKVFWVVAGSSVHAGTHSHSRPNVCEAKASEERAGVSFS